MKKILCSAILTCAVLIQTTAQTILSNPINYSSCPGQPAVFSVTAQDALNYQWEVYSLGIWYALADTGVYSGSNTAQLTISGANGLNGYTYHCIVTDSSYSANYSTAAILTVQTPPAVTSQPISTAVCAGTSASFNIAASGTIVGYQWQANNGVGFTDITDGTLYSGASTDAMSVNTSGVSLSLQNIQLRCIAIGACGADTSVAATLTINALPTATIWFNSSSTICPGDVAQMVAPLNALYGYQWRLNGSPISTATNPSYSTGTAGDYSVVVTDVTTGCSSTSPDSVVIVNPAPAASITLTSANGVCQGDTVSLQTYAAAGDMIQWRVNGADIPNADNGEYYAVTGGDYTVRITNSYNCSTVSAIEPVLIHALPISTITYNQPLTFCAGSAVVLNADTTEAGDSYQWLTNGVADASNTSFFNIVSTSGSYSVTTTSPFGCVSTSAPLIVTVNPLPQPLVSSTGNTLTTGSFVTYQWYYNNQQIAGANSQTFTATQTGDYSVEVTDVNGCPNKSAAFTVSSLGVADLSSSGDLRIFPNPSIGIIHIASSTAHDVIVRSTDGRTVFAQKNAKDVDLTSLPKGMYLLVVNDEKGIQVKTERIVLSN